MLDGLDEITLYRVCVECNDLDKWTNMLTQL